MIERRQSWRKAGTIKDSSEARAKSLRSPGAGGWHGAQVIAQHVCGDRQSRSLVDCALTTAVSAAFDAPSWAWKKRASCADAGSPSMRRDAAHTTSNVRNLSIRPHPLPSIKRLAVRRFSEQHETLIEVHHAIVRAALMQVKAMSMAFTTLWGHFSFLLELGGSSRTKLMRMLDRG